MRLRLGLRSFPRGHQGLDFGEDRDNDGQQNEDYEYGPQPDTADNQTVLQDFRIKRGDYSGGCMRVSEQEMGRVKMAPRSGK